MAHGVTVFLEFEFGSFPYQKCAHQSLGTVSNPQRHVGNTSFLISPGDLQQSSYERGNRTGKLSDNRHFCARSLTFVRVWLRRFIGYSLVIVLARAEQCRHFGESSPPPKEYCKRGVVDVSRHGSTSGTQSKSGSRSRVPTRIDANRKNGNPNRTGSRML
jgi:hypothetical protein